MAQPEGLQTSPALEALISDRHPDRNKRGSGALMEFATNLEFIGSDSPRYLILSAVTTFYKKQASSITTEKAMPLKDTFDLFLEETYGSKEVIQDLAPDPRVADLRILSKLIKEMGEHDYREPEGFISKGLSTEAQQIKFVSEELSKAHTAAVNSLIK